MSEVKVWKQSIENYKSTYYGMYGKQPTEKLIESHCKIQGIPYPLPKEEICPTCGRRLEEFT